jgi:hypothetical protein
MVLCDYPRAKCDVRSDLNESQQEIDLFRIERTRVDIFAYPLRQLFVFLVLRLGQNGEHAVIAGWTAAIFGRAFRSRFLFLHSVYPNPGQISVSPKEKEPVNGGAAADSFDGSCLATVMAMPGNPAPPSYDQAG